jgi:molybdenum cofactor guanylyltransferase
VFCLCRRDVHEHLKSFLQGGGRKIDAWYKTLNIVEVSFDDEEEAFNNFNTREEMDEWQ